MNDYALLGYELTRLLETIESIDSINGRLIIHSHGSFEAYVDGASYHGFQLNPSALRDAGVYLIKHPKNKISYNQSI